MKSKVSLLCTGALFAGLAQSASAMDFSDSVYGKANVSIGYNYRSWIGDVKTQMNMLPQTKSYKSSHSIMLGLGYNVYYKANDWAHPFFGLEATGQFDLKGRTYLDGKVTAENVTKYWEFFRFNGKFGTKFIVNQDLSVSPYATLGFTVIKTSEHVIDCESPLECPYWYKYLVGLTTGAGIDVLVKDRFSVGVEYRYVKVQKKFAIAPVDPVTKQVWKNHNIAVKFGYHFL